jgi:BirA family biotin operon repressor/biotin-[acetyl-CoA-carboxylase] ligase
MSYNKKNRWHFDWNVIKSDRTIHSIVGLGLNVNQTNFEMLPKASSLAVICDVYLMKKSFILYVMEKKSKTCKLDTNIVGRI